MGLALEEIVAAAEVLFAGRPDLIDSVRRAAAGLPGEDLEIPTSEWEELARYELNHWLSEPVPIDDGPALMAVLGARSDAEEFRYQLQAVSSHPESLGWEWFPGFVARLREVGWSTGEIAEKLVDEIGDRGLQAGAALVQVTEFESADAADSYELCFIDAGAVDRLDAISTAVGCHLVLRRTR
ncbi:hypothetical protein [Nocardia niigatensis]|uniref:hypothetical protein n=1 Tax=Nocardia niigatensis TaxID=209249 RepID=UPI000307D587|nr:hypothetical protein [Nocardia niigatensis]